MDRALLDLLTVSGPRLPWISSWLMEDVWTMSAFKEAGSPSRYLEVGENRVKELEVLLAASSEATYRELVEKPPADLTVKGFFDRNPEANVVILDGCSIRELPRLVELAGMGKRRIRLASYARAAVPSETEDFVADRLGFGLPRLGPSALSARREFHAQGVTFHYHRNPPDAITLGAQTKTIIWSRFPDQRYLDSHAASSGMYDGIWDNDMELVWKKTAQALPPDKPVLVTSDHGFVFLGGGLDDTGLEGVDEALDGKRNRVFEAGEQLPNSGKGLFIDPERRLGVLIGRCHNKPRATSPYHSLFRHGGLSLMEMLTPWLVLEPMEG
jgi:hypothetical protein